MVIKPPLNRNAMRLGLLRTHRASGHKEVEKLAFQEYITE